MARQKRGGPDQARLLWLAGDPGYLGIRALPTSTWHVPGDQGLLAVSVALPAGLDIWRGQTITVWRDSDGSWWRQGSMLTLARDIGLESVSRPRSPAPDARAGHAPAH